MPDLSKLQETLNNPILQAAMAATGIPPMAVNAAVGIAAGVQKQQTAKTAKTRAQRVMQLETKVMGELDKRRMMPEREPENLENELTELTKLAEAEELEDAENLLDALEILQDAQANHVVIS